MERNWDCPQVALIRMGGGTREVEVNERATCGSNGIFAEGYVRVSMRDQGAETRLYAKFCE